MRRYLPGLFALAVATPAFAHDPAPSRPAPDAAKVDALLSNPAVQDAVAATVDQFADALLQTRIGPLAPYADPQGSVRPQDTLGDLAARDHPNYRQDLRDNTRSAVATLGHTARDVASMTTELRRTADRLRGVLARAQGELGAVR